MRSTWWRRHIVAWWRDLSERLAVRAHVRTCGLRPCPSLPWARQLSWPRWKKTRSLYRGELIGLRPYLEMESKRRTSGQVPSKTGA